MSIGKNSINRAEKAISKKNKTEAAAVFSVGVSSEEQKTEVDSSLNVITDVLCKVPVSDITSTYSESSITCGVLWKNLVESVKKYGIIEPLILRKAKNGYRVISGHKRLFAAKKLGITQVDAKIIETDDEHAAALIKEISKFTSDSAYQTKEKVIAESDRGSLPDYLL